MPSNAMKTSGMRRKSRSEALFRSSCTSLSILSRSSIELNVPSGSLLSLFSLAFFYRYHATEIIFEILFANFRAAQSAGDE